MPTQMEIEYWRNQHQRMNYERFVAANGLALITHTVVSTHEFDLPNFIKLIDPTSGHGQDEIVDAAGR